MSCGYRTNCSGCIRPETFPAAPMQRELCYEAFAILHSGASKTPVFVAERLTRASIEDANEKRTNKFFADARLPRSERAELSDYKGSGYARGHMAPAGDMPNPTAMAQSFSLANMVPQNPTQNSGAWSKIEQDTRRYVPRAKGNVFVITGPVFGPQSQMVGANRVRVPTHLFKLVYDERTGKAWAHWQPNSEDARAGRPISYGELTQRVGMELLPGVEVQ
ncbi:MULTISPECIES: DNA/RNA non-specific endonuclease [Variovorax]|uniref:DNA/RNA non-specific endonuclease n=1 Tax=Variovorax TaxID=34072 RepID=UPI0039BDC158